MLLDCHAGCSTSFRETDERISGRSGRMSEHQSSVMVTGTRRALPENMHVSASAAALPMRRGHDDSCIRLETCLSGADLAGTDPFWPVLADHALWPATSPPEYRLRPRPAGTYGRRDPEAAPVYDPAAVPARDACLPDHRSARPSCFTHCLRGPTRSTRRTPPKTRPRLLTQANGTCRGRCR